MSLYPNVNQSISRDGRFTYLKSIVSDRVPLATFANLAALTAGIPPGSREEGSVMYNTGEPGGSLYMRGKNVGTGAPEWVLVASGGGGAIENLEDTLTAGNTTGTNNIELLRRCASGIELQAKAYYYRHCLPLLLTIYHILKLPRIQGLILGKKLR